MALSAIVAYLHYLGFMTLFGALLIERLLCRPGIGPDTIRTLARVDAGYGLSAGLVLITGVLRVLYFGKGAGFYLANPVFLCKVGIFLLIGLLSIYPTAVFIRWRKAANNDPALRIAANRIQPLGFIITVELIAVAFLPLLAALMARGVGL